MNFDPVAQANALIAELHELRDEMSQFRYPPEWEHRHVEDERAWEYALEQAATAKIIGEHPEIHLTDIERQAIQASGYELVQAIREMREGYEFLRETLPQHFQS